MFLSAVLSARKERGKMKKDIKEKRLEEHNDVFADILNVLLFSGKEQIKPSELSETITETQYKHFKERLTEEIL